MFQERRSRTKLRKHRLRADGFLVLFQARMSQTVADRVERGSKLNIRCAMKRRISSPYSAGWIHFSLHLVPDQGSQCRGGAFPSCMLQ
jgi:hypothetical protein